MDIFFPSKPQKHFRMLECENKMKESRLTHILRRKLSKLINEGSSNYSFHLLNDTICHVLNMYISFNHHNIV